MKIASVTLFCNEGFRLNPWVRYFSEYKDDIYLQIIVNNGNPEDTILLKSAFPDAVVLFSILLKKDSEIVENYGAEIDFSNMLFRHIDRNVHYKDVKPDIAFRTGLPGGCFLTKRIVYETIGLQDERINMYSDEVDTGIKCANKGYTLLSTKLVKSWHQHIFPSDRNQRSCSASYFMSRNPIYLARKYYGVSVIFGAFWSRFKLSLIELMSCVHHLKGRESFVCSLYSFKGCFAGLFMKM